MFNLRYKGPRAHTQILNLADKFSYPVSNDGACQGIARTAIKQFMSGEFDAFESALAATTQLEISSLPSGNINDYAVRVTRQRVLNFSRLQRITPFLQEVSVNQTNKTPDSLRTLTFQCCYRRESLVDMMQVLKDMVSPYRWKFALEVHAADHAIGIAWEHDKWLLIDSNAFPVKQTQNAQEVATFMMEAFTFNDDEKTDGFAMEFYVYVDKESESQVAPQLLLWKSAQQSRILDDYNSLSKLERNRLFKIFWHEKNNELLCKILPDPQININQELKGKKSAILYWAAIYNEIEIVKCALQHEQVDVNLGIIGFTPLYAAANMGCTEIVSLLLNHPSIEIDRLCVGLTPQDIATARSEHEIVALIENHRNQQTTHKRLKIG